MSVKILHLYPREMNLYGDRGNILALKRRLEWRGIEAEVIHYEPGDKLPEEVDIIFGGGGQDSGQEKIADDFIKIAPKLKLLVEKGVPALLVCGMYQLFGEYYELANGKRLKGAGIFSAHTIATKIRHIDNIVIENPKFGKIIGYENHSGLTYLDEFETPLGTVVSGFGNNGKDKREGIIYKNAVGTYLHGPILPKNPKITDFLIKTALENRDIDMPLERLNDDIEEAARASIMSRLKI